MVAVEDIWREHKPFILSVGIGAVVFFMGLSWIWSTDAQVTAYVKQGREAESEIQRLVSEDLSGREGFEAGVGVALEKEIAPSIRSAVEFSTRPDFALKEGDSAFIVYGKAIELVKAAVTEGKRRNMVVPEDFGFVESPPEERVRVHIAGADLCERVLSALVSSGFRSVESVKIGDADYVRTVEDAPKAETVLEPGAPPEKPPQESPVLRRLPVRVSATGSLDAVELFLSGFQRAENALEVAGLRVSRMSDGLVKLDVELGAVSLVSAAEAKTRPSPGGPGRRPTGTRPGVRPR